MARGIDSLLWKRGVATTSVPEKVRNERWLTREEAIAWLKIWRDQNMPKHNLYFPAIVRKTIASGTENVYLTGMINELIEQIRESNDDPVTTVANYYYEMDEVLATSDDDHFITHRFAGYLERASYDALLFLKEKEKEMNG